jgi:hypothetical protein
MEPIVWLLGALLQRVARVVRGPVAPGGNRSVEGERPRPPVPGI